MRSASGSMDRRSRIRCIDDRPLVLGSGLLAKHHTSGSVHFVAMDRRQWSSFLRPVKKATEFYLTSVSGQKTKGVGSLYRYQRSFKPDEKWIAVWTQSWRPTLSGALSECSTKMDHLSRNRDCPPGARAGTEQEIMSAELLGAGKDGNKGVITLRAPR
jgi:hypothetical protein